MGMLDFLTGGKSGEATADQQAALAELQGVQTPTTQQLTLPELQKYAKSVGMDPAQMQAFLQQNNALANQNIDQTGTGAQQAAIAQLAQVADAGASGSPTAQAQEAQINQDAGRNLAGQRGAIDQQAQARGVAPGMLQAALGQVQAGQGQQDAHMAALQAQGQNYQQALQAMASGATAGQNLQGQQNTQGNTVAQAQNAMQQFNAANQQQAGAANAGYQQAANATNTQNANAVNQANTGLANDRTKYNAGLPQQVFQDSLQKAQGFAGAANNAAGTATAQGQQNAGGMAGLLGTAGTVIGGMYGGPMGAAVGGSLGSSLGGGGQKSGVQMGAPMPPPASTDQYKPAGVSGYAEGGTVGDGPCMTGGGMIPGKAKVPGNNTKNDTVPIKVSPGEAVIPRTAVQQNPIDTMRLLRGGGGPPQQPGMAARPPLPPPGAQTGPGATHHPADVAALLAAMHHLRGGNPHAV